MQMGKPIKEIIGYLDEIKVKSPNMYDQNGIAIMASNIKNKNASPKSTFFAILKVE